MKTVADYTISVASNTLFLRKTSSQFLNERGTAPVSPGCTTRRAPRGAPQRLARAGDAVHKQDAGHRADLVRRGELFFFLAPTPPKAGPFDPLPVRDSQSGLVPRLHHDYPPRLDFPGPSLLTLLRSKLSLPQTYRVRVLDPDVYDDTVRLKEESSTYCERISQMIGAGDEAVSKIEKQAKNIEEIKLAAIGQRNKLSATRESQAKEEKELKQKVLERQEELERLKAEYDSLCKVRDEQESMIEKLAEHAM